MSVMYNQMQSTDHILIYEHWIVTNVDSLINFVCCMLYAGKTF